MTVQELSLELVGISKSYVRSGHRGGEPAFVLRDIHLHLKAGERFVLLGPSGCGKTTLLKLVAGLLTPDAGKMRYEGEEIQHMPAEKRGFSLMFQQPLLFPHMTAADNVAFGLRMRNIGKAERRARAMSMLERMDMGSHADRYPSELSGGQQQRVALARALALQPSLLLLDEPFSALDGELRLEMRRLLLELQRQSGLTMMFVTHDRDEALAVADRIGIIEEGRLLQVGSAEEIYLRPATPQIAIRMGYTNVVPGRWFSEPDGIQYLIRPDQLRLHAGVGGSMELQVVFRESHIQQSGLLLRCEYESVILEARVPFSAGVELPPSGEKLTLYINVSELHCFEKIGP